MAGTSPARAESVGVCQSALASFGEPQNCSLECGQRLSGLGGHSGDRQDAESPDRIKSFTLIPVKVICEFNLKVSQRGTD